MPIRWDPLKNEWLKRTRGTSFEEVLRAKFITIEEHPTKPHQMLMLFELNGYILTVPYVQKGDELFLKTIFPSRKYTKRWRLGEFK